MELFRKYANVAEITDKGDYADVRTAQKLAYSKESQIPPRELQEFQALWDDDAPSRCEECNARIDNEYRFCKNTRTLAKSSSQGPASGSSKTPTSSTIKMILFWHQLHQLKGRLTQMDTAQASHIAVAKLKSWAMAIGGAQSVVTQRRRQAAPLPPAAPTVLFQRR